MRLKVQKKMMRKRVKGKKRVKRKEKVKKMREKKVSFCAKASDVKSAFYTNHPIFVPLYKEACFCTNELDGSLPSVVIFCCRNMRTCFLTMCQVDCHLLEE